MATPEVIAWKPLGELLVERGLLTPGELDDALDEQERTSERLGAILVRQKVVAGAVLTALLAEQAGVELETQGGFGSGLFSKLARQEPSGSRPADTTATSTPGQRFGDGKAVSSSPATSDPAFELSALRAELDVLRARNADLEAELASHATIREEAKAKPRRRTSKTAAKTS